MKDFSSGKFPGSGPKNSANKAKAFLAIFFIVIAVVWMGSKIIDKTGHRLAVDPNQESQAKGKKIGDRKTEAKKTGKLIVQMKNPRQLVSNVDSVKVAEAVEEKKKTEVAVVDKMTNHPELSLMEVKDQSKVAEVIEEIKKDPNVLSVEEEVVATIPETENITTQGESSEGGVEVSNLPNDPQLTWGYQNIKADEAPEELENSPLIAVLDTGVDYTHPELAGKVILGPDFHNGDADPMDDHGHGTHCAGIAASIANNNLGSAGVASKSKILAIKVLDSQGSGSMWNVMLGIMAAADNPDVKVISMSLGSFLGSASLHNYIDYAAGKGKTIVAAAGNSNTNDPYFPAFWSQYSPGVVAVAANQPDNCKAYFSNYGFWVSISAPGTNILSSFPGNTYKSWNGTSMATPFVAGAAARIFSQNPNLANSEVRQIMMQSGDQNIFGGTCWPDNAPKYPFEDRRSSFTHLNLARAMSNTPILPGDKTLPTISITSPAPDGNLTFNQPVVELKGTASDNDAISKISWNNDRGGSGLAIGTSDWNVSSLPLFSGANKITVTAIDRSQNQKSSVITLTYLPDGVGEIMRVVSAGEGDALENNYNGSLNLSGKTANIGKGTIAGFHFENIAIPKDAVIQSAILEVNNYAYEKNSVSLVYFGEATDNASVFKNESRNLSSRVKTLASQSDNLAPWNRNEYNASVDLRSIVQEIVNRPNWNSGQALNIFAADNSSTSYRSINMQESGQAPRLVIKYGEGNPVPEKDTLAPTVVLLNPTLQSGNSYKTDIPTISISGTASDNIGLTKVTFSASNGQQGDAQGTESWLVDNINLQEGTNRIQVSAYDAAGNKGGLEFDVIYEKTVPKETKTIELKIQSGIDDSGEKTYNGVTYSKGSTLNFGKGYLTGLRFSGVAIPKNAVIKSAILKFNNTSKHPISVQYFGEASGNSEAFKDEAKNLSSRKATQVKATESLPEGSIGEYSQSANLASIIQEIINNEKWDSGHNLTLLVNDNASAYYRSITAFEKDSQKAPFLVVEFE